MTFGTLAGLATTAIPVGADTLPGAIAAMSAEITKRTEWLDEDNGDGQVTLQYASVSGGQTNQKNLNLILIQDKSGSMDSNYAYNIEKVRSGWVDEGVGTNKLAEIYYPIQNSLGYSESLTNDIIRNQATYEDDIATATYYRYRNPNTNVWSDYPYAQEIAQYLPREREKFRAFDSTVTVGGSKGDLLNGEGYFNAPCNVNGHYYLLVRDVSFGDVPSNDNTLPAFSMVEGQLLNNIWDTDKHEYELLSGRDEAMEYLAQGRRVVKIDAGTNRAYYPVGNVDAETGTVQHSTTETDLYFLDISTMVLHGPTTRAAVRNEGSILDEAEGKDEDVINGWFLATTPSEDCHKNDRLSLSQQFASDVITEIAQRNTGNKIAYIPFWGDVPTNGKWENGYVEEDDYDGGNSNVALSSPDEQYGYFNEYPGVTQIGFTQGDMTSSDLQTIYNQINNDFVYDGTNWTNAFQAAAAILDNRTEEDKQTETLVVFLTDGNPQGTRGLSADYDNAYINGNADGSLTIDGKPVGWSALTDHEGVTVISVGVGVAIGDTGLVGRLDEVDTSLMTDEGHGTAILARTNEELANLTNTVMDRINQVIYSKISGINAFYADQLALPFALNESKINATDWAILQSADTSMTNGVPTNVYNAATQNGKKYVYVRNTKTVYWHIGDMTDGDFNAAGHEMVFPIAYSDYNVSTNGADKTIASNTQQKLTYIASNNLDEVQTVTTDTPYIIFNRMNEPTLTVEKTVTGASFDTDQTYRYLYTTNRQESGQISVYSGAITVTIKAGSNSGSATATGVRPGTYYVYEVDNNNNIISSQINTVTLSQDAEITTAAYSSSVPHSATASDNTQLENRNNVLTIVSTNGLVSYVDETTSVSVEKTWDDNDYENRPQSVTVSLLRNGVKVNEMVLSSQNNWQGTFENLPIKDAAGNDYEYTVTEGEIIGYQSEITETQDNHFVIKNTLLDSTIHVNKYDADGKTPLAGVTFEIRNSDGDLVDSQTTESDGRIDFTGLMPDTYTITETSTVDGMTLLPEPITVTMPMVLTEQEVIDNNVDTSKCVYYNESGTYLVCEISYSVTNSSNLDMPSSGGTGNPWIYVSLFGGLLILGAAAAIVFQRKKTHR